jgi:hypothetical protein
VTFIEETVQYINMYCPEETVQCLVQEWGNSTGTTGIAIMAALAIFYLRMKRG